MHGAVLAHEVIGSRTHADALEKYKQIKSSNAQRPTGTQPRVTYEAFDYDELPKHSVLFHGNRTRPWATQQISTNTPLYLMSERSYASLYSEDVQEVVTTRTLRLLSLTPRSIASLLTYLQTTDAPLRLRGLTLRATTALRVVVDYLGEEAFTTNGQGQVELAHPSRMRIDTDGPLPPALVSYRALQGESMRTVPMMYLGRVFMMIVCSLGVDGVSVPPGFKRPSGGLFHPELILCNPFVEARAPRTVAAAEPSSGGDAEAAMGPSRSGPSP